MKLKYNLQFFADDDATSVETPDVADPVEGEGDVQSDAGTGDSACSWDYRAGAAWQK